MDNEMQINYEEHRRNWFKQHPGSIIRKPRISSWGLIFGIGVWGLIALGAALVSGAHSVPAILQTIPEVVVSPLREILSLFGFTIFELLIFAGAVYRRESQYAAWGLMIAMIGALAANIGSSILTVQKNSGDWLNLIVAIVLALIAPLAAFLAGEMVHRLIENHRAIIQAAWARYEETCRELDIVILRDFKKVSKPQAVQLSNGQSIGQNLLPAASNLGHKKRPDATQVVQQHLTEFPADINREARDLAAFLGVGKSTVNNVQRQMKSNGSGNILQ